MADKKITQLTALTGATTAADDPLVIVDLSTNETKKINASELFKAVPAGSAAAPAIVAQGDQNTGIYFPAADNLAFVEGGVEAMRIDANGNVGVGAVPSAWGSNFRVIESTGGSSAVYAANTINGIRITSNLYNDNTNFIYKTTGAAAFYSVNTSIHQWFNAPSGTAGTTASVVQRMVLDANGNLGVGATPSAWSGLTAVEFGSSNFIGSNGGNGLWTGNNIFFNGSVWVYKTTAAAAQYVQQLGIHQWFNAPSGTSGTTAPLSERMRIDIDGNVGIGTTSPATFGRLAVAGNTVPTVTNSFSLGTSTYRWSNVHATTFTENGFNVVSQTDLGSNPNEVPLNQYLGQLAYQDQLGLFNNLNTAPTLLSATTIQPVSPIQFVSGTTAIVNITVPPEFAVGGGQLTLIPTGLWTTTTAGNIALATTAVVNRAVTMFYDAATTKWYPSY